MNRTGQVNRSNRGRKIRKNRHRLRTRMQVDSGSWPPKVSAGHSYAGHRANTGHLGG